VKQFSAQLPANTNLIVVVNDVPRASSPMSRIPLRSRAESALRGSRHGQPAAGKYRARGQAVCRTVSLFFPPVTATRSQLRIPMPDESGTGNADSHQRHAHSGQHSGAELLSWNRDQQLDHDFTGTIAAINTALQGLTYARLPTSSGLQV
jgi:hypothetical protein